MPDKPIYVEILIRSGIDPLWEKTQNPVSHQKWDLRFSSISYLPREDGEPQRFHYQTRIGGGIAVNGTGESISTNEENGARTSILRFWSSDIISLISSGGGYWKYIPQGEDVRFITRYSYNCRFGFAGMVIDRWLFRPLLGWATAISFDCLRMWIERGIPPEITWLRFRTNAIGRFSIAMIWIWHGLVPKLLFPHDERVMLFSAGFPEAAAHITIAAIGIVELIIGVTILSTNMSWPLILTLASMPLLATFACLSTPHLIVSPFTPVSLSMAMMGLAIIGVSNSRDLPSARRSLRNPIETASP